MSTNLDTMSRHDLLGRLPAEVSARFAECLDEVVLKQYDLIVERNGELHLIYFPIGSLISMVVDLANGNTVEALTVGKDGFADSAVFFGKRLSTFKGIVQISGTALTMPVETFKSFLAEPAFRQLAADYVEQAMALIAQSSACLAFHP